MTNQAKTFFDGLATRGYEPLLDSTSGTLRFDVADGRKTDHWYVTVKKGDVTVSHDDAEADAVLRLDKKLFEGVTAGTVNSMAAMLRNQIRAEGDLGLLISFQRVFPGPPRQERVG
jgi:putative sterol carrier protein